MDNLVWGGVPTQRKRKGETFTNPVFVMAAIAKGTGRKISFNAAAQTALGIQGEDHVTFGFDKGSNRIFITKCTSETPGAIKLTKTCSLSHKRTFEYIVKSQSLNDAEQNVFNLISVPGESFLEAVKREGGDMPSMAPEATSEVGVTALGDVPSEPETEVTPSAEVEAVVEPTSEASATSTSEEEGW